MASGEFPFSSKSIWQFVIFGFFTYVVIKVLQRVKGFWNYHKYFNSLPGETDFHLLYGNLHKIQGLSIGRGRTYMGDLVRKFPRFHRLWFGPTTAWILCVHNDTAKQILRTSEPKPRSVGTAYICGIDWLGEGLLISNGRKWARNRRLLTPAFHFDILQPYINIKNKAADILLDKIENCVTLNKSFELFEYMSLCTLDILLRCAFSYTDDIQTLGERHPYIKAINELGEAWMKRVLNPFLHSNFIYYMTPAGRRFSRNCKYVHSFAEHIIEKRKQELGGGAPDGKVNRKYMDFLDILLNARDENNEGLSATEIRNETDTFLFEGHDTTTSALSWTMFSLAEHPEYQRRLQEEVDQIMADEGTDYVTMKTIQKMEYMTMCLKEGLRVHSPVPFIQRKLTKEIDMDGYKIPAGTTVGVQIYMLHHNAQVWDDPDEFRPERFSTENMLNRDAFSFVPFSAGPRNCIGQTFAMHEMKVLLARILHRYTIEVDDSIPVERRLNIVSKSANGIHVFAKPRNGRDENI